MAQSIKLAEALLRRKELQVKLVRIRRIKESDVFEVKARRQSISDSIDDIVAEVPKLELNQVTKEFDHYAKQLRLVDAAIQNANWTTEIEVGDAVMCDFSDMS